MSVIEYRPRGQTNVRGNIPEVAERIEALKKRNAGIDPERPEGFTTPREVFEDGKDPSSPLHRQFTWNKGKAALKWNLVEARRLITCYEIHIIEPNRKPIVISPGSVHVRDKGHGSRFVSTPHAMSDEDTSKQVLADCLSQIRALQSRLSCLKGIAANIVELLQQLSRLIEGEIDRKGKKKR